MLILCWINFYAEELAWKQAELSAGHFPFMLYLVSTSRLMNINETVLIKVSLRELQSGNLWLFILSPLFSGVLRVTITVVTSIFIK